MHTCYFHIFWYLPFRLTAACTYSTLSVWMHFDANTSRWLKTILTVPILWCPCNQAEVSSFSKWFWVKNNHLRFHTVTSKKMVRSYYCRNRLWLTLIWFCWARWRSGAIIFPILVFSFPFPFDWTQWRTRWKRWQGCLRKKIVLYNDVSLFYITLVSQVYHMGITCPSHGFFIELSEGPDGRDGKDV